MEVTNTTFVVDNADDGIFEPVDPLVSEEHSGTFTKEDWNPVLSIREVSLWGK